MFLRKSKSLMVREEFVASKKVLHQDKIVKALSVVQKVDKLQEAQFNLFLWGVYTAQCWDELPFIPGWYSKGSMSRNNKIAWIVTEKFLIGALQIHYCI